MWPSSAAWADRALGAALRVGVEGGPGAGGPPPAAHILGKPIEKESGNGQMPSLHFIELHSL